MLVPASHRGRSAVPIPDLAPLLLQVADVAAAPNAFALLLTGLVLGLRHGIDWDHIAAMTDITSTTAAADAAEAVHDREHELPGGHRHPHGGDAEHDAHGHPRAGEGPGAMLAAPGLEPALAPPGGFLGAQRRAILLGTLYAIGHAVMVAVLGIAALAFGAALPEWIDPIMGRVVGITLVLLAVFVFVSLYQYARYGHEFRLRSRWMLAFDGIRYGWRRLQAKIHGHEHVRSLEMTSYGPRTALAVGMVHGIGAETGTQVVLIAAIGGAAAAGLGVPMMLAFIVGLLISNTLVVILSAGGFVASQLRRRIYLAIGLVAGFFSLVIGVAFVIGAEGALPDLYELTGFVTG